MLPKKGGGAPKGAGVDTAVAHKRSAACVALSRRALLWGDALAFRRSTAALARDLSA